MFSFLFSLMLSKESLATLGLGKMIGAAWVIFTTVYFLLSMALPTLIASNQNGALQNSFNNGESSGYQKAVLQLGQALGAQYDGGCKEPVPVSFGTGAPVGILSANCLQTVVEQAMNPANQQAPAGQQAPVAPQN